MALIKQKQSQRLQRASNQYSNSQNAEEYNLRTDRRGISTFCLCRNT
jgi:hypothetical protein